MVTFCIFVKSEQPFSCVCVYHAMLCCLILLVNLGDTTTLRQNNRLKC